jgi:hypothetical protein
MRIAVPHGSAEAEPPFESLIGDLGFAGRKTLC